MADDQLDRGDPGQSNHNPHRHRGRQAKPAPPTRLPLQRRRRQQLGLGISIVRTRDQPPVRTAGGPRRAAPGPPSARRAAALPPGPGNAHRPRYQPSPPLTRRRRPRACPARPGTTRPEPQSRRPASYPPPAAGSTPEPTAPRTEWSLPPRPGPGLDPGRSVMDIATRCTLDSMVGAGAAALCADPHRAQSAPLGDSNRNPRPPEMRRHPTVPPRPSPTRTMKHRACPADGAGVPAIAAHLVPVGVQPVRVHRQPTDAG